MSTGFGGESLEAYLLEEAAEAERFTARARLALVPAFIVFDLALAPFSEFARASLPVIVGLTLVAGAYALAADVLARRRYAAALSYATTAMDTVVVTLVTVALSLGVGDIALAMKSSTVLGYFVVIAVAGLRLSAPLPVFAAGVASLQLVGLLLAVLIVDPARVILEFDDLRTGSVSASRAMSVAFGLLAAGGVTAVLTHRARELVRRSLHTLTFLYCDLRGFTSFIEQRGDAAGTELVREYRRLVRAEIARAGGRELKTEGDSFLIEFRTARQALQCATAILGSADVRSRERPELPLRIGVGLHAGEPIRLEQDYIGSAVNVAARLGQAAEAGELLASDVVRGLLRTSDAPPAREREGLTLKGIADPPRVYAFDWRSGGRTAAG